MGIAKRRVCAAVMLVSGLLVGPVLLRAQEAHAIRGFTKPRVEGERELEQKLRTIPDPAHTESNLRHITSEPHMAGTEGSHRLAEWLRDQYRS